MGVYFVFVALFYVVVYSILYVYFGPNSDLIKLLSVFDVPSFIKNPQAIPQMGQGIAFQESETMPGTIGFWEYLRFAGDIMANVITGGGATLYKLATLVPYIGPVLGIAVLPFTTFFTICGWTYIVLCALLRRC